MKQCQPEFERDEKLRSAFVREIALRQLSDSKAPHANQEGGNTIPKRLVQYWHDLTEVPADVLTCMNSWSRLADQGIEHHLFSDESASAYIAETFSDRELRAFARCEHPAMRSDYFRMCYLLVEGGLYVDADDVLVGDDWKWIFEGARLKLQPLCYDLEANAMAASSDIWQREVPATQRVFYVNNNPMAAPPRHALLRRALESATAKLLEVSCCKDIQATTGPGNMTAALTAHAWELREAGVPADFEFLRDWEVITEVCWNLSYRNDTRNWRNVYGC